MLVKKAKYIGFCVCTVGPTWYSIWSPVIVPFFGTEGIYTVGNTYNIDTYYIYSRYVFNVCRFRFSYSFVSPAIRAPSLRRPPPQPPNPGFPLPFYVSRFHIFSPHFSRCLGAGVRPEGELRLHVRHDRGPVPAATESR